MQNIIFDRILRDIGNHDVVLYMKGTAVFPQCGFSAACVQILSQLGVQFKAINVMDDKELHKGLKEFVDWPRVPQLYIKGEFTGGADIIREMYETGELSMLLAEKDIPATQAA